MTIYDYESIIDTNDFIEYLTLEFGEKMKKVKKKKNYEDKIIKVYLDKTYSRKLLEPLLNKYFEKFKFINNNK
jgi:flagellar biosynthesis chaperone FliJ